MKDPLPAEPPAPPPPIPFVDFMADALYGPGNGYYSVNIKSVGRGGDFSTSATLHPILGKAVRAWIKAESNTCREVRDVIEVGPGDGSLMAEVRKGGWMFGRRFRYHLVESSPVLGAMQRARFKRDVHYHSDIRSALHAAGGRAFIYSNELVDAFPATLLQWDRAVEDWSEVCVTEDIVVRELTRPFDAEAHRADSSALTCWNELAPPPHLDQRIEIHFSYRDWLRSWAGDFEEGAMLTIDYGDLFPDVYHRRPRGTIRGYFSHIFREGGEIYQRPGHQDITADVNFTDLVNWSRGCGWETDAPVAQADFIREYAGGAKRREEDPALDQVLMRPGAGDAFKVLTARVPH